MIKDFQTYISEGLFNRNQSEFNIRKTDKGIEQVYIPKTKDELYSYIDIDIEKAKKDGTYPNINLNNIDVSELGNNELRGLFCDDVYMYIDPDISNWNIKYIPSYFFYDNKQIKEFTIPDGVISIEYCAFSDCSNLTSVTIPDSVTSIEKSAFSGCGDLSSVMIPDSVTSIESYAFYGCKSLTSVTIPDSVTSIGDYAFFYCKGLISVEIGNSVTNIGKSTFDGCGGLTSITISKNCHIEANSFPKDCKIIRR